MQDTSLHGTMGLWCLIKTEVLWRGAGEAAARAAGTGAAEWKGRSVHKQRLREPTTTRATHDATKTMQSCLTRLPSPKARSAC